MVIPMNVCYLGWLGRISHAVRDEKVEKGIEHNLDNALLINFQVDGNDEVLRCVRELEAKVGKLLSQSSKNISFFFLIVHFLVRVVT